MKHRISRNLMIEIIADTMPQSYADDLPAIRQAVNDHADCFRKDGCLVHDFAQDSIVRAIRRRMAAKMARAPRYC